MVKNGVALKMFGRLMHKGSSVAHSPYDISYNYYSMVGWSIASISDLCGIFIYLGASCFGKYGTSGQIYWLWSSLPYYINYNK